MIGSLRGKIIFKYEKYLLVETAGVGYKVAATTDTLSKTKAGQEIFLFIHTHIREDALDLYGFTSIEELEFFELLLGVSSIGPRSAIGVLGVATLETLRKAISAGDASYLTKVSGIGKKTAEKIVLELRDKVGAGDGATLSGELDALEALTSLGYSQSAAREALKQIPDTADINTKIREALKVLGGK